MRSGPAAGHTGIFHEAAFYSSDEEFLAVVLPFLHDGVAAGEPTVSLFGERNQRLVRAAVGTRGGVTFIDGGRHYLRPAAAIRRHREMLAGYVADGAAQVRIAGDIPHPGVGVPWEWWARYEAAANEVYDEFPMYGLCPYDTRTASADVLDDVRRTHPHVVAADGRRLRSPAYQDPRDFLTLVTASPDPLEAGPPALELADPSPMVARNAISTLQDIADLGHDDLNGLVLSVSEAVTNGLLHGRPPVRLRAWAEPGRILVTVTDRGRGPTDPTAGLMPAGGGPGGLGLWLMHQLCAYVSLQRLPDGFTVRLIAEGSPA